MTTEPFELSPSPADPQPVKGKFNGHCNRSACQQPPATWWNPNTSAYYCRECAFKINAHVPLHHRDWRLVEHMEAQL